MPDEQAKVAGGQSKEERSQKNMSDEKLSTFGPVGMGEVKGVDQDAYCPVDSNESSKTERGSITSKKLHMQREGKHAKSNDGQHGETALHPKELAVERDERLEVLLPAQLERHLKTCQQDQEMTSAG